jgi:hypothetical protein
LQVVKFVVDETPYACWDWELITKNLEFLQGIDAAYFRYVVETNTANIEGEDQHRAALSLRLAYSQGLETLFALLCSAVQAPQCVVGWMLSYKNEELQRLVQKITKGYPIYSRLNEQPVTWGVLSKHTHAYLAYPPEKLAWIQEGFERLWTRFAGEFANAKITQEYNSAKHGLRTRLGGFSLYVGREETPGIPAPSERMQPLGGSVFGTSYFMLEKIVGDHRLNFRPRNRSRNWSPKNLSNGLGLLSMSINNVVSFLRIVNGVSPTACKFLNPNNRDAFNSPWDDAVGVEHFDLDTVIRSGDITPVTKNEVFQSYGVTPEK